MQPLHSTDAADAQWQAIELPTRRPRCGRVEWLQRRVALRTRLGRLGSDLAAVKIVKLVVVAARVVIALGSGGNAESMFGGAASWRSIYRGKCSSMSE